MGSGKTEKPEHTPRHGVLTPDGPAAATNRIILPCPGFKVQVGASNWPRHGQAPMSQLHRRYLAPTSVVRDEI